MKEKLTFLTNKIIEVLINLINKTLKIIKNNYVICIVLLIYIILHQLALSTLGVDYSINSDDISYIISGKTFFETGIITMHGDISAQIMPGMTFFIAFLCLIFGTGSKLMLALKLSWIIFGFLTIIVVYKTIKIFTNQYIAAIPCFMFLTVDYVWMNNLILTETPYILIFSLLVYHTIRLGQMQKTKDYILIVIYYIIGVFIRPNIGIFPIFIFIYLILNKYDFKRIIKQGLIAGIILIAILTPWAYRNYKLFDRFIPLTYGIGNPLLLGTYQGSGYPSDEELDYKKHVDDKMSKEMKYYRENPEVEKHLTRYYNLEYDGLKAKYRMKYWWEHDKISMLKSYLYDKPYGLMYNTFYWDILFGIERDSLMKIRKFEIILFIISSILILIKKKYIKEWITLVSLYMSQVMIYAYTYSFGRYAVSMYFIRYIIITRYRNFCNNIWGITNRNKKIII